MTHEELRQAVFERDNFTCQYCGRYGRGVKLEIDHIIPVSKGGATDIRNLITACRECNRAKRNRLLTVGELQEIADKINTSLEYLISLADRPPAPAEEAETIEAKKQYDTSGSETEKAVRTSLLIDAKTYKMLALLAALENKTMTEILTAGAHLYIEKHSQEAAKLQEAINARSK